MKSLRSVNISGQSVLMRVDFNVPINEGKILDDFRIERVLPTIQSLREKKAKRIILISHLGQPTSSDQKQFSLRSVASCLEELLEEKVYFITTLIGEGLKEEIEELPDNSIILIWDCRKMKGYDSDARVKWTDAIKEMKAQIETIWLIADSSLIKMGAALMGMVASINIKTIRSEDEMII